MTTAVITQTNAVWWERAPSSFDLITNQFSLTQSPPLSVYSESRFKLNTYEGTAKAEEKNKQKSVRK